MKRVHASSSANLFAMSFGALLGVSAAQAAVNISDESTKHMSCSAGVCSPTAKGAVLNTTDLANMLQAADVTVMTGSGAITIEITAALSWASSNRLTLDANCNVSVKAPVTVAGPGGLTIVTNDGGSGCDLLFFPGGKVDFWDLSSSLVVNQNSYVLVSNIATLASDISTNAFGHYAISNDYDTSKDGVYRASPVATTFDGTFEGLGHVIDHLTINGGRRGNIGLFAMTDSIAVLRDIDLTHVDITSNSHQDNTGALVGNSNGSIINASASGTIRGGRFVGGLAGGVDTALVNSIAAMNVYGGSGTDTEWAASGGLVGYAANGSTIERSHATGAVSGGSYAAIGGLVGVATGSISESYATGPVAGSEETLVGGLAGWLERTGSYNTIVQNSYSIGSAASLPYTYVGGLIGEIGGTASEVTIGTSYSVGAVIMGTRDSGHTLHKSHLGGLVGSDAQQIHNTTATYWNLDTSGVSDPSQGAGHPKNDPGITGLSDAQLKSGLPAGFDSTIWGQNASINNGYPYLLANPPP